MQFFSWVLSFFVSFFLRPHGQKDSPSIYICWSRWLCALNKVPVRPRKSRTFSLSDPMENSVICTVNKSGWVSGMTGRLLLIQEDQTLDNKSGRLYSRDAQRRITEPPQGARFHSMPCPLTQFRSVCGYRLYLQPELRWEFNFSLYPYLGNNTQSLKIKLRRKSPNQTI